MGSRPMSSELDRASAGLRVAFGSTGPVVGVLAGVLAWTVRPSVPLAIVLGVAVARGVGRVIPDLLAGGGRARSATAHAVFPAALLVAFGAAAVAWGIGLLAGTAAFAVALGLSGAIRRAWLPDVFLADEVERLRSIERRQQIDQEPSGSLGRNTVTEPSGPRSRA